MSALQVGDTGTLTIDGTRVRAKVAFIYNTGSLRLVLDGLADDGSAMNGLYVGFREVGKFTPDLKAPTEPGLYADNEGDVWLFEEDGTATIVAWEGLRHADIGDHYHPASFVPFTRLVPEVTE